MSEVPNLVMEDLDFGNTMSPIRLKSTIEYSLDNGDTFDFFGFEINKMYVYVLLAVLISAFGFLIYTWYFDESDDEVEEPVDFETQQLMELNEDDDENLLDLDGDILEE